MSDFLRIFSYVAFVKAKETGNNQGRFVGIQGKESRHLIGIVFGEMLDVRQLIKAVGSLHDSRGIADERWPLGLNAARP